jgi:tol-pal system protein YbgF
MKRTAWPGGGALALVLVAWGPAPAAASDKAHQQLMAEIRMLQEQQQQLQQVLGGLAETLKTVTAKIDEQSGVNRKAFADQKLLVDNLSEGVRMLREKADDTNVRLSSMNQELEAVRQAVASSPAASAGAAPGQNPAAAGDALPGAPGAPQTPPPTSTTGTPVISPQRMFDSAQGDYAAGDYDIAISGFNAFIKTFPKSDKADEAQLKIGSSYYGSGRYREAVEAFQKVITNYPQSNSVAPAYYKLGQTYESLKQIDLARKAYEMVVQKYPNAYEVFLAKQGLDRLKGK